MQRQEEKGESLARLVRIIIDDVSSCKTTLDPNPLAISVNNFIHLVDTYKQAISGKKAQELLGLNVMVPEALSIVISALRAMPKELNEISKLYQEKMLSCCQSFMTTLQDEVNARKALLLKKSPVQAKASSLNMSPSFVMEMSRINVRGKQKSPSEPTNKSYGSFNDDSSNNESTCTPKNSTQVLGK